MPNPPVAGQRCQAGSAGYNGAETTAKDEAKSRYSQQPDGAYVWDLLLYSGFGFTGMPTDVEAISIVADEATFYGGPGQDYEPVASVVGGMVYPVSGVSTDGQWWRLVCYDDNNVRIPNCWVSADPAISQTTTLP